MNTATIEVARSFPPKEGKKKATIKTTDGELFGAWPNMLHGLQPGGTYEIEYDSRDFEGKTYRTIKKFKPTGKAAERKSSPVTDEAKPASADEMAFIAKIVGAGIASQQIDFNSDAIMKAAIRVRSMYRELLRQSQ